MIRVLAIVVMAACGLSILPATNAQDSRRDQLASPVLGAEATDADGAKTLEGQVAALRRDVEALRSQLPKLPKRALPADAYPLNLGKREALRIAREVLAGQRTVATSVDELTYYGGGVSARPRDGLATSITINWKMIAEELTAEEEVEKLLWRIRERAKSLLEK